jgi:hypothetical protein
MISSTSYDSGKESHDSFRQSLLTGRYHEVTVVSGRNEHQEEDDDATCTFRADGRILSYVSPVLAAALQSGDGDTCCSKEGQDDTITLNQYSPQQVKHFLSWSISYAHSVGEVSSNMAGSMREELILSVAPLAHYLQCSPLMQAMFDHSNLKPTLKKFVALETSNILDDLEPAGTHLLMKLSWQTSVYEALALELVLDHRRYTSLDSSKAELMVQLLPNTLFRVTQKLVRSVEQPKR